VEELKNPSGTDISPVFPNPANENINMVIRTPEPENLNFAIYSLNGQKIISDNYLISGIRSLNISIGSLQSGIYLLMVTTHGGQLKAAQKFVKF
jgi:hypothetical protein